MSKPTVEKYRVRPPRPPSPSWRTFWNTHVAELVALDCFTVPTIGVKVLFVLIVLAHDRRKVLHFNVTEHPTAQGTAPQRVEAFPRATAPTYLRRDRDAGSGEEVQRRGVHLGIEQVLTAPRSPWQHADAERLIGSIRRECLAQVIRLSEGHLRRLLTSYFTTTIAGARISRWPWTALRSDRYTHLSKARWSPSRKWVDPITPMRGWRRDLRRCELRRIARYALSGRTGNRAAAEALEEALSRAQTHPPRTLPA